MNSEGSQAVSSLGSLDEVRNSVSPSEKKSKFGRLFAYLGPAYLVSVGYMDPGNWATDIAGGSKYGYSLIWVLVISNLMAILLQSLCVRLGVVRGLDLAQASRERYPKYVNIGLWILAELAIAACDLAEVLGLAIGLNLLTGLPILYGVIFSLFDTLILMQLQRWGIRKMEAFILTLVAIIGASFLVVLSMAEISWGGAATGLVPSLPDDGALYLAIGIIGATVMPHNLYLHSALVQTRRVGEGFAGIKQAIKFNIIDSVIALNAALVVNASLLLLGASVFFTGGYNEITELQDAHKLLEPLLGSDLAPKLFAIALIAAGQSSTITGTLAGQVVMEGHISLRLRPWLRRLITRLLAIVPAVITILILGEDSTGELLILSQVILSLQLGFAVIPLIRAVSDKTKMGLFPVKTYIKILAWLAAGIIIILNIKLVIDELLGFWDEDATILAQSGSALFVAAAGSLLLYILIEPWLPASLRGGQTVSPHHAPPDLKIDKRVQLFSRIAVAVDFSATDSDTLQEALRVLSVNGTIVLIHVNESATARFAGPAATDLEAKRDAQNLENYAQALRDAGYLVEEKLGFGRAPSEITRLSEESGADLIVMGAHGHNAWRDLLQGETVGKTRHQTNLPVFIAKKPSSK